MAMQSRLIKDQRSVSRVAANLECQFAFEKITYEAHITNLSMNGAFLSSSFTPPKNGHIVITLPVPHLKKVLILESKVVRTDGSSQHGFGAFAVRFSYSSLDLIELIKNLISQPLHKV